MGNAGCALQKVQNLQTIAYGMLSCTGSLVESDEILMKSGMEGSISFGFALCWRLEKKAWISRHLGRLKVFCVQRNKCTIKPVRELQIWCSIRLSDTLPTIASIMLWYIWKSRCKVCLVGEESRPKETVIALQYDLSTKIRAQYEELEGSSNTVEIARLSFQNSWSDSPLVDYVDGVPEWCYTTPNWLFPPQEPNHEGTWFLKFYILQDDKHILG